MQIRIRHLYRATVQRATHAFAPPIENMGIDHRGFDILVAKKLLNGPDIITVRKKMCSKPGSYVLLHYYNARP